MSEINGVVLPAGVTVPAAEMERRQAALFEQFVRASLPMHVPGTEMNLLIIAPDHLGRRDGFMGMSALDRVVMMVNHMAQKHGIVVAGPAAGEEVQVHESTVRVARELGDLSNAVRRALSYLPAGGYAAKLTLRRALGLGEEVAKPRDEAEVAQERRRKVAIELHTIMTGDHLVDVGRITNWIVSLQAKVESLEGSLKVATAGLAEVDAARAEGQGTLPL